MKTDPSKPSVDHPVAQGDQISEEMRVAFRHLSAPAQASIKLLAKAEIRVDDGSIALALRLLETAQVLQKIGKSSSYVSSVVGAAARAMLTDLVASQPAEYDPGGRPRDEWWSEERSQAFLDIYRQNPHLKKNQIIHLWSMTTTAKTMPRSTSDSALRKRLDRLIRKHQQEQDLIAEFDDLDALEDSAGKS